MKNHPKHSTKQLLIVSLVVVVLLIGFHVVALAFIRSAGTSVSNAQNEARSLQAQVVEFSKYSSEDLSKLAQDVTSKIVPKDNFVGFIEMIENQARSQNLEIVIRSFDTEPLSRDDKSGRELIKLQLETNGSWSNTMKFVNYLEHLPYKVEMRNVGLTSQKENGSGVFGWQGRVEMTALKFK